MLVPQATPFDARYFADPDNFRPGRFNQEGELYREFDPYAFIPFRRGRHFARMEVKAVLYQMLLQRNLSPSDGPDVDLEYLPMVRPTNRMEVRFTGRCNPQS